MEDFPFADFEDFKRATDDDRLLLGVHRIMSRNWVRTGVGVGSARRVAHTMVNVLQWLLPIGVAASCVACASGTVSWTAAVIAWISAGLLFSLSTKIGFWNAREAMKEAVTTHEDVLALFWIMGGLRIVTPDGMEYAYAETPRPSYIVTRGQGRPRVTLD